MKYLKMFENFAINEALNIKMSDFKDRVQKKFEEKKFKFEKNPGGKYPHTGTVMWKLYEYPEYEQFEIVFNEKDYSKIEKIISYFQLAKYTGKEVSDGAWTVKKIFGTLNPGDIYLPGDKPTIRDGFGSYTFVRTLGSSHEKPKTKKLEYGGNWK